MIDKMTDGDVQQALDALPVGYNRAIVREAIQDKDAEITRLRRDLAALQDAAQAVRGDRAYVLDRNAQEIARLRAALKPFAEFGRSLGARDRSATFASDTDDAGERHIIVGGDFHDALKALEEP